jgi:hypothetical protein
VRQSSRVSLIREGRVDWEIFLSSVSLKRWICGMGSSGTFAFSNTVSSSSRNSGTTCSSMTAVKVRLWVLISPTMRSVNVRTVGISVLLRASTSRQWRKMSLGRTWERTNGWISWRRARSARASNAW